MAQTTLKDSFCPERKKIFSGKRQTEFFSARLQNLCNKSSLKLLSNRQKLSSKIDKKRRIIMFKKICFQLLFIAVFASVPAFAAKVGCQKFNFLGSFTRVDAPSDVFGDGTVI